MLTLAVIVGIVLACVVLLVAIVGAEHQERERCITFLIQEAKGDRASALLVCARQLSTGEHLR